MIFNESGKPIYNLFISHSWSHSDKYNGLCRLLNNAPSFQYKNYSVPKDDPIHNAPTDSALEAAIKEQIKHAHCVLILAGVYASYSRWIQLEIKLAKEMNKKIIAIKHFDSDRISTIVQQEADVIVGWNTNSIISEIKKNKCPD